MKNSKKGTHLIRRLLSAPIVTAPMMAALCLTLAIAGCTGSNNGTRAAPSAATGASVAATRKPSGTPVSAATAAAIRACNEKVFGRIDEERVLFQGSVTQAVALLNADQHDQRGLDLINSSLSSLRDLNNVVQGYTCDAGAEAFLQLVKQASAGLVDGLGAMAQGASSGQTDKVSDGEARLKDATAAFQRANDIVTALP